MIQPQIYVSTLTPGGQYGYKNHTIAFPHALNTFTESLPRVVSDTGIIIVRKPGTAKYS